MSGARTLRLENVHAFYGKSHVLHGVSLEVKPGEIVSLLGRNGAGRSTMVKT
ncbi:MAG: ATP-binding cassette domain-containing protein, partial [Burkholderiaceae bacterium]|nr:ATP-binding cassette domain-containing protein [Burkholderiaceae bacterium]